MKLKDFYEPYLERLFLQNMATNTIAEHRRFVFGSLSHPSIKEKEISDLKLADRDKIIDLGKHYGQYGPQRSIIVFRQILKFIHETGHELPISWRDIPVPKVPGKPVESLTPEEMDKIRNSLSNDLAGIRTRALIELLFDTGMRISEAISLNKEDIDWKRKEIKVLNAKTKEYGMVYLTDRSIFWLKKYLEVRKDKMEFLLVSGRGRLLSSTSRNYFRSHFSNLGIRKHIKHHIFRKSFVTTLLQNNVDLKSVQDLARHASERTTLRYYVASNSKRCKKLHQKVMSKL